MTVPAALASSSTLVGDRGLQPCGDAVRDRRDRACLQAGTRALLARAAGEILGELLCRLRVLPEVREVVVDEVHLGFGRQRLDLGCAQLELLPHGVCEALQWPAQGTLRDALHMVDEGQLRRVVHLVDRRAERLELGVRGPGVPRRFAPRSAQIGRHGLRCSIHRIRREDLLGDLARFANLGGNRLPRLGELGEANAGDGERSSELRILFRDTRDVFHRLSDHRAHARVHGR